MFARNITDNVWILETTNLERLGIINYNPESSQYSLISSEINLSFSTFDELGVMLNETVKVKEKDQVKIQYKDINGYPIQHDSPSDIIIGSDMIQYNNKSKVYYAGYWCTPSGNNTSLWYVRVGISTDIYNSYIQRGVTPIGPFKDKMEALFGVKQGENYCKNNNITLD